MADDTERLGACLGVLLLGVTAPTAALTADLTRSTKSFEVFGVPSSNVFSSSAEEIFPPLVEDVARPLELVADFSDPEDRFVLLSIFALAVTGAEVVEVADEDPLASLDLDVEETILKLLRLSGNDGETVVCI